MFWSHTDDVILLRPPPGEDGKHRQSQQLRPRPQLRPQVPCQEGGGAVGSQLVEEHSGGQQESGAGPHQPICSLMDL